MTSIRLSMAQALVKFLDQQYFLKDGVEHKFIEGVFGIFGHGNVTGLGEALEFEEHGLNFIRGNNEQGMVHAATAFAKQLDRKKIYAVTSSIGPGATNMITGAATATINRIPVLLLPGDIFASRGPDPVLQQLEHPMSHATTVNDCFKPVSRYFDRIDRPEQLVSAMIKAMAVLTDPEKTGAVTICLPQDVQCESYNYPQEFLKKRTHRFHQIIPVEKLIDEAALLITASERPMIIAGGGVHYAGACNELNNLAQELSIPIAETQGGKGAIVPKKSYALGGLGVIGTKCANIIAKKSDCIIAIGTRLADFSTASKTGFNKNARIISVNVDAFDCTKLEPSLAIRSDAKIFLTKLKNKLKEKNYRAPKIFQEEILSNKSEWADIRNNLFNQEQSGERLSQTQVLGVLNQQVDHNAVVVCAAGSLPGDLQRLWHVGAQKGFHLEYGYSCMGYEIAGGLGVKMAEPEREVWVFVGDGSFLMMHSEIITALQENLKINIVLFDSGGFACIKGLQVAHGSNGYGTDLRFRNPMSGKLDGKDIPIDYAAYAGALGMKTYRSSSLEQLSEHIGLAQQEASSTLIEVKVEEGTQSPGFETFWQVGVSDVSRCDRVVTAHATMMRGLNHALVSP